jgi:hypothetical protein
MLKPSFRAIVTKLRQTYGVPPKPPADPWEIIAREAASYLVDDRRVAEIQNGDYFASVVIRKVAETGSVGSSSLG